MAGAGVGTEGTTMMFSVSENNWLGRGINLVSSLNLSQEKNLVNLSRHSVSVNNKTFTLPKIILEHSNKSVSTIEIKEALNFNKSLLLENFIFPNRIK